MTRALIGLAVTVACACLPPAAVASVRTGSLSDAQDVPRDINGVPTHNSDIKQVGVRYDTSGSLAITVRFFSPLAEVAKDGSEFSINVAAGDYTDYGCDTVLNPDPIPPDAADGWSPWERGSVAYVTFSPDATGGSGDITLEGISGSIPLEASPSSDGYEVTVQAKHPALANRGFKCVGDGSADYSYENFHCNEYGCFDYSTYTIDRTSAFKLYGPGAYSTTPPTRPTPAPDDGSNPQAARPAVLTARLARTFARRALKKKFSGSYTAGHARQLTCGRKSALKFRCRTSWAFGELTYRGSVRVWYGPKRTDPYWYYSLNIVRQNKRCKVQHRRHCSRRYVVR